MSGHNVEIDLALGGGGDGKFRSDTTVLGLTTQTKPYSQQYITEAAEVPTTEFHSH